MSESPVFQAETLLGVKDFSIFPHLPAHEFRKFPDIAAIYVAFDSDDVIYIGRTQSLRKRWRSCRTHSWLKLVCKIQVAWIPVEPERQAKLEKQLIEHYRPLGNICHNRQHKRA